MTEEYINGYSVTVGTGGITNVATSLPVSTPASVDSGFRILIGLELLLVTAGGTSTTWTVTRGIEGTTATSHSASDVINVILSAGSLDQIRKDISVFGSYASLPTSGMKAGDQYKCSDSPWQFYFDGSVWQPLLWGWYNGVNPSTVFDTSRVTTLNGSVNNSVTTYTVLANYGSMPSTPFWIMVDTEQAVVTAVSGTSWTVTRGDGATTAASHSSGANVRLMNFHWKLFDSNLSILDQNNGIWSLNGTASVGDPDHGNGLFLPLPFTSNYTITYCVGIWNPSSINYVSAGCALQDTSAAKWIFHCCAFHNGRWAGPGGEGVATRIVSWTNGNFGSTLTGLSNGTDYLQLTDYPGYFPNTTISPVFLRVVDDGTNLNWFLSFDGYNWHNTDFAARHSYTSGIDSWGVYASCRGARIGITLLGYKITTP